MKTITKEQWAQIEKECPITMKRFKKWIDLYKDKVNWKGLFAEGWIYKSNGKKWFKAAPKFHELPWAMQLGVFTQFMLENKPEQKGESNIPKTYQDVFELFLDGCRDFENMLENN